MDISGPEAQVFNYLNLKRDQPISYDVLYYNKSYI